MTTEKKSVMISHMKVLIYRYNYNYWLFLFEVFELDTSIKTTNIIFDWRRYPSYMNVDLLKIHITQDERRKNAVFICTILL